MKIIRADMSHLEWVAPLFDQYRQFYKQTTDLTGARAFLEARFRRGESVIFLALASETVTDPIGFTQLYPSFSSVSMKALWILNDLFVSPKARRLGVGKALIEAARRHSTETGAKGLALSTAKDNFSAQALYEAVGFARDEVFHRYTLDTPAVTG